MRFIGKVNHDRVNAYYAAADIFVIPSYYEPFGLVALEAMAMRIPVVASRKDGLKATIDDGRTGMLFEPRDPVDLARKISEIRDHPESRNRMIEAARREIEEKYSWGEIAEKISDIYRSLII